MTNPSIPELEDGDVMLGVPGLRYWGERWAGSWPTIDPRVSPIYGDLSQVPPTRIYQGGRDILLADAQRFAMLARDVGADVELLQYPDGFHVFPAATSTPEGHRVYEDMGRTVRKWSG